MSQPSPIKLERIKLPQQIIYRPKGNLLESLNPFKYGETFCFGDFMSNFCEIVEIYAIFSSSKSI